MMTETNKSLKDAINNAARRRSLTDKEDRLHIFIKDYLAQKFTAAYIRAESPEELARLKILWESINGDK